MPRLFCAHFDPAGVVVCYFAGDDPDILNAD